MEARHGCRITQSYASLGSRFAIIPRELGIPCICLSSTDLEYDPAFCTHRPSLLSMSFLVRSLEFDPASNPVRVKKDELESLEKAKQKPANRKAGVAGRTERSKDRRRPEDRKQSQDGRRSEDWKQSQDGRRSEDWKRLKNRRRLKGPKRLIRR